MCHLHKQNKTLLCRGTFILSNCWIKKSNRPSYLLRYDYITLKPLGYVVALALKSYIIQNLKEQSVRLPVTDQLRF